MTIIHILLETKRVGIAKKYFLRQNETIEHILPNKILEVGKKIETITKKKRTRDQRRSR